MHIKNALTLARLAIEAVSKQWYNKLNQRRFEVYCVYWNVWRRSFVLWADNLKRTWGTTSKRTVPQWWWWCCWWYIVLAYNQLWRSILGNGVLLFTLPSSVWYTTREFVFAFDVQSGEVTFVSFSGWYWRFVCGKRVKQTVVVSHLNQLKVTCTETTTKTHVKTNFHISSQGIAFGLKVSRLKHLLLNLVGNWCWLRTRMFEKLLSSRVRKQTSCAYLQKQNNCLIAIRGM